MMISLKQVIQAIEEANEVFTSFWDTKTGKTAYLADPLMTDMTEEDKALASAIEDRKRLSAGNQGLYAYSLCLLFDCPEWRSEKEEIAFAQSYFAVQTRKQELIEERISLIERTEARGRLRESENGFPRTFMSAAWMTLGLVAFARRVIGRCLVVTDTRNEGTTWCKDNRPLADFLPTLSIAAKNLAAEMTNYNVEEKDLQGESAITGEHVQNNRSVRDMLGQRGIQPENLPAAEDTKNWSGA